MIYIKENYCLRKLILKDNTFMNICKENILIIICSLSKEKNNQK